MGKGTQEDCSATRSTVSGFMVTGLDSRLSWASLEAQLVKNLLAVWETWVPSLGWGDSVVKGETTLSSILAGRSPQTPWSMGSWRVGHDWASFRFTRLSLANRSDSGSFLVAHAITQPRGIPARWFWEVGRTYGLEQPLFDLSQILLVGGSLLVPNSLPGPPV